MFRIEIIGSAPGALNLVHGYEDRDAAERIAKAVLGYFAQNKLPDHRQGVQVVDDEGHWVWRQIVGSKPERFA